MARSALTLEGWWKASYTASPWVGSSSAGGSSGRNLSEATNPPATGSAVNGLTPADFDGTNDLLGGAALTTYFTVSAWSIWLLVYVDNVGTNANGEGELVGDSIGTFCLGTFNSSGDKIAVQQYDSSWKSVSTALTKSKWTLVQAKYDGTNMKIRTDGGSWSSVAVGSNAAMSGSLRLAASRAAFSHFFDGKVLEVGCAKTALSDASFDTILGEIRTDYALDLGLVSLAGSSAGTSTTTASLKCTRSIAGSTAGTSTTTATLKRTRALTASTAGTSTTTATLQAARALAGSSAGTSTTTASVKCTRPLAGATAGTSTTTASLKASRALAGASVGTSTTTATLRITRALAGTAAGGSTTSAPMLARARPLAGSVSCASTTSASLRATRALSGTCAGTATTTATLVRQRGITATAAGTAACAPVPLSVARRLAGSAAGTSTTTADLDVEEPTAVPFAGSSAGASSAQASIRIARGLRAQSVGLSVATGMLRCARPLAGVSHGASMAWVSFDTGIPAAVIHSIVESGTTRSSVVFTGATASVLVPA